jgi:hydroxyacylglutathione hydrolase
LRVESSKEGAMVSAVTLFTPALGDRSYLVHDGEQGVAIDPQRDTDRLLEVATSAGIRIAYVAETHVHNDYVSGGAALARQLGVPYLVAAAEGVTCDHRPVHDGDEIAVAPEFSLSVVATPGHTPGHVAYVALDSGRPVLACTGGSLLFGSVGRTDLLGTDLSAPLAREQYRSVHRLVRLPDTVEVLPTHGFGSFCSVGTEPIEQSTMGEQRTANLAFHCKSEDAFVTTLLASLGDYPRYYHRMAGRNRAGADVPDLAPPPALAPEQLHRLVRTDAWVVDLRSRGAFAGHHLQRSINIEYDVPFTTYLGWLLPDDTPLVLMAEGHKDVAAAQLDLSRIGLERVAGEYVGPVPPGGPPGGIASYPMETFDALRRARAVPGHVVLDVRRREEWDAGHLEGALHFPLHELVQRLDEVPPGTIWVHCAAGYRAAIAASLLARHGRDTVLIDGRFDLPGG